MDRIFGDESFEFLTWETSTGAGVKVAISDTGIDESHPDLVGRVSEGVYFTGTDSSFDDNGHGAHVSGTVAPSASLYSAKVLSSTGAVCVGASVSTEIYFNDCSSPYFTGTITTDTSRVAKFTVVNAPSGTYLTVIANVTAVGFAQDGVFPDNSYEKE